MTPPEDENVFYIYKKIKKIIKSQMFFKHLFCETKVKLESELLEEPLVFARLVPENRK